MRESPRLEKREEHDYAGSIRLTRCLTAYTSLESRTFMNPTTFLHENSECRRSGSFLSFMVTSTVKWKARFLALRVSESSKESKISGASRVMLTTVCVKRPRSEVNISSVRASSTPRNKRGSKFRIESCQENHLFPSETSVHRALSALSDTKHARIEFNGMNCSYGITYPSVPPRDRSPAHTAPSRLWVFHRLKTPV